jgi:3-oxoadipate enol-lactonase
LREEGFLPRPEPLGAGARVAAHHTFSQPQLKVALQGKGPAIVMSHALGLDLHMWDDLAAALASTHTVLRYDHRGHGGSALPPGPYSMDELVADAARLIREWDCGPVVWVGLSMGGMVGQGLAIRHPELVRGLVLANTSARYPQAAKAMWAERIGKIGQGGLASIADMVMERYFHAGFRAAHPQVVDRFRRTLLVTEPKGYVACSYAVASVDWLDQLARLKVPTLVIAGALDVGAPVEMSEAIVAQVSGAELVVIDDASHLSVIEQPSLFEERLRGFLGRLPRRTYPMESASRPQPGPPSALAEQTSTTTLFVALERTDLRSERGRHTAPARSEGLAGTPFRRDRQHHGGAVAVLAVGALPHA